MRYAVQPIGTHAPLKIVSTFYDASTNMLTLGVLLPEARNEATNEKQSGYESGRTSKVDEPLAVIGQGVRERRVMP